ncbi:uncharacterized protein [Acropora muricata]|uniref:uncharacterized protein isoform X2 n=1 Tax=Acropora muricata TaxID=159855 RepID=UPI0034E3D82D
MSMYRSIANCRGCGPKLYTSTFYHRPSVAATRGSRPSYLSSHTASYVPKSTRSSPATERSSSYNYTGSTDPETVSALRVTRSSASNLSGRPFELPRPRETSRTTSGSSHSTNYSKPVPSSGGDCSEPVISTSRDARSSTAVSPRVGEPRERRGFHDDKVDKCGNADWNRALKTSDQSSVSKAETLIPREIALHETENRRNHHTDKYEHSSLIVRRGQSFDATLTFNRAFNSKKDDLVLQFAVGEPNEIGSIVVCRNICGINKL